MNMKCQNIAFYWQHHEDAEKKEAFITPLSDSLMCLLIASGQANQLNNFDFQMFTPPQEQSAITPGTSSDDPIVSD